MAVIIANKNNKRIFNQEQITIGSDLNCDYVMSIGEKFLLTIHYREEEQKCIIINSSNTQKILHKNVPLGSKSAMSSGVKFQIANSDDFLIIKISDVTQQEKIQREEKIKQTPVFSEPDVNVNQSQVALKTTEINKNLSPKEQLEEFKKGLEDARTAIIKETGFAVTDLKKRILVNDKSAAFVHIAIFVSSFITAFGLSNYLTGLKIEETANFISLPMNIKVYFFFGILVSALCFILKHGVFLFYQNKTHSSNATNHALTGLIITTTIFFIAVYVINLLYYININPLFAILISLFFVGLNVIMAYAGGYFKYYSHSMGYVLDQYEYREDFEAVMNDYRNWIEKYINFLSNAKIENIKDKLLNLQLKSIGETILGVLTAPFLAYGVSNTLAQCFPEAAGWVRISGLRFSPVFLVLSTFMIVFAFFAFTSAFTNIRKIEGSDVIKQDGFSNYISHGVNILGVQAVRKLNNDKVKAFMIGCAIIAIEFTMNTSYFLTEIGGDLQGILLSLIAALVPTALLIAETFMLSATQFEKYACDSLLSVLDRD